MTTNPYINPVDPLLIEITDYVLNTKIESELAYSTASLCLMDSLGCALRASQQEACKKLLGPIAPGCEPKNGVRVPGTSYRLDPVQAAFNIGSMIRWLDYNDTWLAAEWGHPSDNLGGILAVADYIDQERRYKNEKPVTIYEVLTCLIKAYEIQGVLALENSFNQVGLDHVLLVRVATTAIATMMLGGQHLQIVSALSNAWLDGGALRTYRHKPNTGSRKSWAAGDATSRGVWLAFLAMRNEMGYPTALSAKNWGFCDVLFKQKNIVLSQPLESYVVENILFKVSYPAEFHAQTAVEAAVELHAKIGDRLDDIQEIVIETQQAAIRIIDKTGPLNNPADRDHCLQYMIAIALLFGRLSVSDYEANIAQDPRIDALRATMRVIENRQFSSDYLDPAKRSIANAISVTFRDGSCSDRIEVAYPIGHVRRRATAIPLLYEKFIENTRHSLSASVSSNLLNQFKDPKRFYTTTIDELFSSLF